MMLELANTIYNYDRLHVAGKTNESEVLQTSILSTIKENCMLPLFERLSAKYSWKSDDEFVSTMRYVVMFLYGVSFTVS
jgi:hypothetical protein